MTDNPCAWCVKTSEMVDSMESEVERLADERDRLLEAKKWISVNDGVPRQLVAVLIKCSLIDEIQIGYLIDDIWHLQFRTEAEIGHDYHELAVHDVTEWKHID